MYVGSIAENRGARLLALGGEMSWHALDAFSSSKALEDVKERTLGGGLISICGIVIACYLFASEFSQFRIVETIDRWVSISPRKPRPAFHEARTHELPYLLPLSCRLDVDTSSAPDEKLAVNMDIYLPSLPCSDLMFDVVDDSGMQQLGATASLHKLRMNRHGVPIDIPQAVNWDELVAPGFQQRKLMSLMTEVGSQLRETMSHFDHEAEENPQLTTDEHETHRRDLSEQAALLQGRLSQLVEAAAGGEQNASHGEHFYFTSRELSSMHDQIAGSQIYSADQREVVLSNLHAMSKNLERLPTVEGSAVANLHEALRIRLTILEDNVRGFVTAADIDRRDKYRAVENLINDVANASAALKTSAATSYQQAVGQLRESLATLSSGAAGQQRRDAEADIDHQIAALVTSLRNADLETVPADYCGSCYGASTDPTHCCNTCNEVRKVYRQRRWSFPDEKTVEQCMREKRNANAAHADNGDGCNVYGTMEIPRVSSSFNIAPASMATTGLRGGQLWLPTLSAAEVAHFNVTHFVRRFSFGTDFPGQDNPLDDSWVHSPAGAAVSRYFLKASSRHLVEPVALF
tara:strand:+ start:2711 stop:4441 length:1731 start_codon:yes stop_codon:yes gene_type:complete